MPDFRDFLYGLLSGLAQAGVITLGGDRHGAWIIGYNDVVWVVQVYTQ